MTTDARGAPAGNLSAQGLMIEEFIGGNANGLLVGDIVFMLSNGRAQKTTNPVNYNILLGIVVGGDRTFGNILQDDLDIGTPAALLLERVLVAWGGIVKGVADAAISAGDIIAAGVTTAGRVRTAVTGDFPVGNTLDDASNPGDIVRIFLSISKISTPA